MQAQHVFDVAARAPPTPSSSSHEVVGNEQEASSVDAVGVPGHDRRKLGDRPGRRITLQQEVQHRHHRCLARPEAGQVGGLRSAIGQGEGPIAARSELRGDDVIADRALGLVDSRGETYDKVSVVGSMGKAVDGVVLCTSKPDHRLRERLPHRLRIGEASGNTSRASATGKHSANFSPSIASAAIHGARSICAGNAVRMRRPMSAAVADGSTAMVRSSIAATSARRSSARRASQRLALPPAKVHQRDRPRSWTTVVVPLAAQGWATRSSASLARARWLSSTPSGSRPTRTSRTPRATPAPSGSPPPRQRATPGAFVADAARPVDVGDGPAAASKHEDVGSARGEPGGTGDEGLVGNDPDLHATVADAEHRR